MKKMFYTLKNKSGSEGTYLLDGEYKPLYGGEEITLERPPVNKTSNITLTMYKRDVGNSGILRKKPVKLPENETKKSAKLPENETEKSAKQNGGLL